ncbi:MAG: hypothetical protein EOP45_20730 [Sphingobacteriaceae bacterium]|nr:MAG: hypothetical protein EOP45_20730 [Sphingobacteriaceae bacterium]
MKTCTAMRKYSLLFKRKEELLFQREATIWILLRGFQSHHLLRTSSIMQKNSLVSARKYLGVKRRHTAYMIEDGEMINLRTMSLELSLEQNTQINIDLKRVKQNLLNSVYMIDFESTFSKMPSIANQLWFWKALLRIMVHCTHAHRVCWTQRLFTSKIPSDVFRIVWNLCDWPWVDAELHLFQITLSGPDVLWLMDKEPSFELYLDRIQKFDPVLIHSGLPLSTWNWWLFSQTVSEQDYLKCLPLNLPFLNDMLISNNLLTIHTLLQKIELDEIITHKDVYYIAQQESDLDYIEQFLLFVDSRSSTASDILLSCFKYKRYDFIRD